MSPYVQAQRIDSSYNNAYYQGRMEFFSQVPMPKKAIVFLGNSITEQGLWYELLPGQTVLNRGIGGDNTFGVLARLPAILLGRPAKIFLLIGINDIGRGHPVSVTATNYEKIIQLVQQKAPGTKLYLQSVLPLNDHILKFDYLKNKNDSITLLNKTIQQLAIKYNVTYIDLHPLFADHNSELRESLTLDGIHLRPVAYIQWVAYLKKLRYL